MLMVYCGNWDSIPANLKAEIQVIDCNTKTQKELFEMGLKMAEESNGEQRKVFTNNDYIVYGLRIGVKESQTEGICERIQFVYYDELSCVVNLHKDGSFGYWPKGFLDQLDIVLSRMIC